MQSLLLLDLGLELKASGSWPWVLSTPPPSTFICLVMDTLSEDVACLQSQHNPKRQDEWPPRSLDACWYSQVFPKLFKHVLVQFGQKYKCMFLSADYGLSLSLFSTNLCWHCYYSRGWKDWCITWSFFHFKNEYMLQKCLLVLVIAKACDSWDYIGINKNP